MGEKEPTYDAIPARRWVSLEEMGQIALFLCGPCAKSFVGHILLVDGGATLYGAGYRGTLAEYRDRFLRRMEQASSEKEMFGPVPAGRERQERLRREAEGKK